MAKKSAKSIKDLKVQKKKAVSVKAGRLSLNKRG
jgi:hypothetical protein